MGASVCERMILRRSRTSLVRGFLVLVLASLVAGTLAGRARLGRERPRTLQMIGATNPRLLHRISADLQPDTSQVVHIQVPYYIDRPKVRTKKFKPWTPRGQRFVSSAGGGHLQQLSGPASFGSPFAPARETPHMGKPAGSSVPSEFQHGTPVGSSPGPYDTPFVPVMKPSPVNPLHAEHPAPEIMFEPISILPLEAPSFATMRNHVRYLRQKQAAFFEGQGREFGFGGNAPGATIPDELEYFREHERQLGAAPVHNGDAGREEGEQNTLSEDDFGQNDRKYDRRGQLPDGEREAEQSAEADFYDAEGKQYADEDFEDSREEADRAAAFEPKKMYTQVRHQEVVRHIPLQPQPDDDEEDEEEEEQQQEEEEHGDWDLVQGALRGTRGEEEDGEEEEEDNERDEDTGEEEEKEGEKSGDRDEEADGDDEEERHENRVNNRPIKERVKLHRTNIVYSEKGREAQKFDHGSAESFGEFEQNAAVPKAKGKPTKRKSKRNRIKRTADEGAETNRTGAADDEASSGEVVDVLAWLILGNDSHVAALPVPEALTDPRELHGDELLKFLDEAIQNTTQYLPEAHLEGADVISIVSPPSNVVKFPYYTRPAAEIDVDSALRYAENLTTFSGGPYGAKAGGVECNEVDVELEDEPEPTGDGSGGPADGFRPIKRLQGLGDKIDCLKAKHFGRDPLDNPLFREEFVGGVGTARKSLYGGAKGGAVRAQAHPQPNPAVAVYNDVIRHIKKHLASQQRKKNSKSDTEQDTVMIAVPRVLRLDPTDGDDRNYRAVGVGAPRKREPRLVFHQTNPLPFSNHISVPIFDISKYVPRFMMRANDDLFAEDGPRAQTRPPPLTPPSQPTPPPASPPSPPPPPPPPSPASSIEPVKPRQSTPKVRLQTLVRTAEQLAEGAVAVEDGVERQLTTGPPAVRDDIADAFDDVLAKQPTPPAPLPPIRPYSVVEKELEATFNKSGPPYAALALEPPVAQSILKQRIASIGRNQLDFLKGKWSTKMPVRKARRPAVTRKKVLVFYH